MKSLSDLLISESVTPAQRWSMPSIGEVATAKTLIDEPPRPALHTADELDAIADAARQEGYQQGFAEGRMAGLAHADVLITRVQGVLANLARPLEAVDDETQQQLTELSLMLAERILRQTLPQQPTSLLGFIRESLDVLNSDGREVALHLHPEDASAVTELIAPDASCKWRVTPDRNLRPGDVRIQTPTGAIDGRVRQRLEALLAHGQPQE